MCPAGVPTQIFSTIEIFSVRESKYLHSIADKTKLFCWEGGKNCANSVFVSRKSFMKILKCNKKLIDYFWSAGAGGSQAN